MPNIPSMFAPIAFRTATHAGVGTGAADADGFSARRIRFKHGASGGVAKLRAVNLAPWDQGNLTTGFTGADRPDASAKLDCVDSDLV